MKKFMFLFLSVLLLTACNPSKVFERYEDINNYKWEKDKIIQFEVTIEDTNSPYDVELALRHTSYYQYANLLVNLTTIYPSGETRTRDYDIMLKNPDHSFKAEGAGDLWDINIPLLMKECFREKGNYIFKVQNVMPYLETDDIMQVGLVVKKSKS